MIKKTRHNLQVTVAHSSQDVVFTELEFLINKGFPKAPCNSGAFVVPSRDKSFVQMCLFQAR